MEEEKKKRSWSRDFSPTERGRREPDLLAGERGDDRLHCLEERGEKDARSRHVECAEKREKTLKRKMLIAREREKRTLFGRRAHRAEKERRSLKKKFALIARKGNSPWDPLTCPEAKVRDLSL